MHRDFEQVVIFANTVRSRLEEHDTYAKVFLCGISVARPHEPPARRCHLPKLDGGIKTTVAFKKLAASCQVWWSRASLAACCICKLAKTRVL